MPQRCDLVNTFEPFPPHLGGKGDPSHIIVVTDQGERRKPWSDVVEGMAHLEGGAWHWIGQLIEAGWHATRSGLDLVLVWATPEAQIWRA